MDERYSAYKEFNSRLEAEDVVRALTSAGFDSIETDTLYSLQTVVDVGSPPRRKWFLYEAVGLIVGGIAGGILGTILFGVPSATLGFPRSNMVVLAGILVCSVASAVVGVIEGFILAKRGSLEPISGTRRGVVGVRVFTNSGQDMIRAKGVLADFGEPPEGRVRNHLFRWSHN